MEYTGTELFGDISEAVEHLSLEVEEIDGLIHIGADYLNRTQPRMSPRWDYTLLMPHLVRLSHEGHLLLNSIANSVNLPKEGYLRLITSWQNDYTTTLNRYENTLP